MRYAYKQWVLELTSREVWNRELRMRAIAEELLEDICLPHKTDTDEIVIYRVVNPSTKEVVCIGKSIDHFKQIVSVGYDGLPENLKLFHQKKDAPPTIIDHVNQDDVREIVTKFITEKARDCKIAPFLWKGEEGHCLKRLDISLEAGATPAWDEFLVRTTDPSAFCAFVWSIFEMSHRGRQALYLWGDEGEDGKSYLISTLAKWCGAMATTLRGDEQDNRFALSGLYDKRFLAIPDLISTAFVRTQLFRNITGSDNVSVEFKGMTAFNAHMNARVMVGSNFAPNINDENSDKSRLLIIKVRSSSEEQRNDATWGDRLMQEMPQFLYRCRSEYLRLCPGGYKIGVDNKEAHEDFLDEATSGSVGKLEGVFNRLFLLKPGSILSRSEFYDALAQEKLTNFEIGLLKRWMKSKYKVEESRGRQDGIRRREYRGLALQDGMVMDRVGRLVK